MCHHHTVHEQVWQVLGSLGVVLGQSTIEQWLTKEAEAEKKYVPSHLKAKNAGSTF